MKASIRIRYHVSTDFRYNLLIVCRVNGCKNVIKDNVELMGYGNSMKVKDEIQHGRVNIAEPKEDPATIVRCPFGNIRPPFLKLRL